MLNRETFVGPWAGLPVAWTKDDTFDEQTYREDVRRCCQAGIPGIYTGGTTGEFYAMEFDEFQRVATATVEECHDCGKPAMIGCSSTYTLGAIRRAKFAAEIGADAIQIALPYWMEVPDQCLVEFFQEVSYSCGNLPLSIYETTRTKRTLTLDQHHAIREALPNYLMVKSNANTLGCTESGCRELSKIVNVFVGEHQWAALGQHGARGACSAMVYWNPSVILKFWSEVEQVNWPVVEQWSKKVEALLAFLVDQFGPLGFTDTAYDRLGGLAGGFLKTSLNGRGPYPSAKLEDIETLRSWYRHNFPEMMEMSI